MNRKLVIPALCAFFLVMIGAVRLQAQVVTYTWTGLGTDDYWDNPENWTPSTAYPTDYTTDNVIFGNNPRTYVRAYTWNLGVHGLTFTGNTKPYYVDGNYDGFINLSVGAGGITYTPAQPVQSVIATDFEFTADQTWNIASGSLLLEGYIYDGDGGYVFTKTGAGTLILGNYYNDFLYATINLNNGRLAVVGSSYSGDAPLGSADLVIGPATGGNNPILVTHRNYSDTDIVTLGNNITLNGALTTENEAELDLTGPITLNADTTVKSAGAPLFISGAITDGPAALPAARKLTVDSTGWVVLEGTNTYSGGTHVANGVLVFASVNSLPALPATNALSSAATGYIGFGDDGTTNAGASLTNPQGLFLDRFNKASALGTIGFDTDPEMSVSNDYTGTIDLTGFASSARLGSATKAILSGTITPQGTATDPYRFGGGGGFLQVNSSLTGTRNLVVDSPAAQPLTLRITNEGNSYTGGTSVTNSALIFGSGSITSTFPADGTRDVTINAGGYVGFEFWDDLGDPSFVAQALAKITTGSVGAVGFDNYSYLTVPIDLSSFTNALYLGTSTLGVSGPGLTLGGTITPAGGVSAPYRFAGYKGGALEVASPLTGANGVLVGDPNSPATFGDFLHQEYSKVALTGDNSALTGNVTLYGGKLLVGQSNGTPGTDPTTALGWNTTTSTGGNLVIAGMTLPPEWREGDGESPAPALGAIASDIIIPNNVTLNTELNVGGDNNFTLAGNITGPGELYVGEDSAYGFTLGLTGNNTFSGGVYVAQGSIINAGSNTALGTGPIGFGYSGGTINFLTTAPVIGSLMTKEQSDYAYLSATQASTVLTINQSVDGKFRGDIRSNATPDDSFRVVKNGTGTLYLEQGGMYFYRGTPESTLANTPVSLQVNQGTLVLGNNFYLGETATSNPTAVPPITPNTIWVHGGTLAVDNNYYAVPNPLVVDNGGRLAGMGSFDTAAIGTGAILSPGLAEAGNLGFLQFNHLELNAGGTYEWQIQDPVSQFGHDLIDVATPTTLVINATSANRFTLKIISLALNGTNGALSGFDPTQSYSWSLFNYDSLGGVFDPAAFTLDTSLFANSLVGGPGGSGSFSLTDSGSQILLNFTPVPEPSTYALLLAGLGVIALQLKRRRVN